MHGQAASSTAALVAQATVLVHREPTTRHLVPDESARLSALLVADLPGGARLLRRLESGWFRRWAMARQRATVPGLFLHFALRKRIIEDAARAALAAGARQMVVVGAGYDTLAPRLQAEFPRVRFFELDHPATQAAKRSSLERHGLAGPNLDFVPLDLNSTTPDGALRASAGYDAEAPTFLVLEGLFMYLAAPGVERTLRGLRQAVGNGSSLVLTFFTPRRDGRRGFARQTRLADYWLRRRGEPFLWDTGIPALADLLARCGFPMQGEPQEPGPAPRGAVLPGGERVALARADRGVWVNDVQTRLQAVRVAQVVRPRSTAEVQAAVRAAAAAGMAVSVAGGRHAQGGQQFGRDTVHLDMVGMDRILGLDARHGIVHAEAGIQWPALMEGLRRMQGEGAGSQGGSEAGSEAPWGIRQKQTGADNLTLGGAIAANVHGRGLAMAPIVADIEAFLLVDAFGESRTCSRSQERELFGLVVGGYGLFGVVTEVWLRLQRRVKLERNVQVLDGSGLVAALEARARSGHLYGDFQYATDLASPGFLSQGVLSSYRPTAREEPPGQRQLSQGDWDRLVALAHEDRAAAFQRYTAHYLATDGQVYDSDAHQAANYLEDYHQRLDAAIGATPACEVISELYVPRARLEGFLAAMRGYLRREREAPVYGTIRLIEKDTETVLAWAREPWACTIVNLHVEHESASVRRAERLFRGLIDLALAEGGSFYLTYHRWATMRQVEAAHPRFREFLAAKLRHDPEGRFQSEWYRHMLTLFHPATEAP